MDQLKALKDWFKEHDDLLKDHNLDEKARLAIAIGFDPIVVNAWRDSEKFKAAR